MSVEDKKQERSKAKMAVTVSSRRLIGAANRDADYEIMKSLMIELEKVFDDFCNVNEEFEILVSDDRNVEHLVVNGEDIKTYRESVNQSYQEARNVFLQMKATNQQILKDKAAGPVRAALKKDFCRIHELITVIDKNFEFENLNSQALQLDKNDLQSILNVICDNMTKLGSIETSEKDIHLQKEVDAIVGMVYNRIRRINIYLHGHQASTKPTALPSQGESHSTVIIDSTTLHATPISVAPEISVNDSSPTNMVRPVVSSMSPSVTETTTFSPMIAVTTPTTSTSLMGQQPLMSTDINAGVRLPSPNSMIHLKKMALPTFSGLRKDWPEFKAVWKSVAETAYGNKTALAHELKRSVKGEAKLRIRSVYVTKPEAYDIMWEKLESHYEDASASVQAALEDLHKLRPVKEEDYKARLS